MNQEERDSLKRARDGVVRQRAAAEGMGVSERWVRQLLQRIYGRSGALVTAQSWEGGRVRAR